MAIGDVSNPVILASGWEATLDIELPSGGQYNFGLGPKYDPATGDPKVVFVVTSMSFDDDFNPTVTERIVYGTMQVRQPFPNANLPAESGSNPVTIKFALNDYIFRKDNVGDGKSGVAPVVSVKAGLYTHDGTPSNAAEGLTVTNNSEVDYFRVNGNWSMPGFTKIGNTQTLRCVAFHGSAKEGRSVRGVRFVTKDANNNEATAKVLVSSIDRSFGDAAPVEEYIAHLDTSGLSQGTVATSNFQAFPMYGDNASVLDTAGTLEGTTAGTAQPTGYYGPIKFVVDKDGSYCPVCAAVEATNGSDTNSITASDTTPEAAAAHPFKTIGGAYNALRTYINTTYGRNNCGGATIYLMDNNGGVNEFSYVGASVTVGSTPDCVLEVRAYPRTLRSNVVIGPSYSTGRSLGLLLKVSDVKITLQNASGGFSAGTGSFLWVDRCEIDSPLANQPTFYNNEVWHITRSKITNLAQGFLFYGAIKAICGIIRGNTLNASSTLGTSAMPHVFIGNRKTNATTMCTIRDAIDNQPVPAMDNQVIAFNQLTLAIASNAVIFVGASPKSHGISVIQNILENTSTSVSALCQIAADNTSHIRPVKNVLVWYNVMLGQRFNYGYNESGAASGASPRVGWVVKNNIFDNANYKTDTFIGNSATATRSWSSTHGLVTVTVSHTNHNYFNGDRVYLRGTTPAAYSVSDCEVSGATTNSFMFSFAATGDPGAITQITIAPNPLRVQNWSVGYGVCHSGNGYLEITGIGAAASFLKNFAGLKTDSPTPSTQGSYQLTGTPRALGYAGFKRRMSFANSTAGSGNGDYRLEGWSPLIDLQQDWLLRFDMNGKPRTQRNCAGAFAVERVEPKRPSRGVSMRSASCGISRV